MVEEHLASLGVNLLATGLTAGTGVTAGKVRDLLRRRQLSEDLEDVATEFQTAFRDAIDAENADRDTGELAGVTDDWAAVVDELGDDQTHPPREREQLDLVFRDEQAAVTRVAEAIATVQGYDLSQTPEMREALESALTVAYRRALTAFERTIAGTDLADVFQAETGLVLADRLAAARATLETIEADVEAALTQDAYNEGFRELTPAFLDRREPDPEGCWRTGFSLWDVAAGIPAERSGIDAARASDELLDRLQTGEDRLVVGRPGAGKSTLCKQVAVRWARADDTGTVFYRESGTPRAFGSTDALETAIERADGHVLVAVEDAVRPAGEAIFTVLEEVGERSDVTFLLDARGAELESFGDDRRATETSAGRRHAQRAGSMPRYALPAVTVDDVRRVVEAFEAATGREVGRSPEALHEEIGIDADAGFGELLVLAFYLPGRGESESPGGLTANVAARYETVMAPGSDDALRELTRFDPDLLADVGVMVNLLNASGIGIQPELVHALGNEYGHDVETHDEIAEVRAALEGWFLYRVGDASAGPVRTTHELWSTLYLRRLAQDHAEQQAQRRRRERSEPRVARCLEALFAVVDDDEQRAALDEEFPSSSLLADIEADPEATADEYLDAVFELGERWPVLAPLFGTTETARYELPEVASEWRRKWVVTTRGHAHRNRGAYPKARTEYEEQLSEARDLGDRNDEATSLNNLGTVAQRQGEYEAAREYFEQSLEITRELGDRNGEATSLNNLGLVAQSQGDYEAAREYHHQSLEIERELGDRNGEATSLNNLGLVARRQGEYEAARDRLTTARDHFEDLGAIRDELRARRNLVEIDIETHDHQRAAERCAEAERRIESVDLSLPGEQQKIESLRGRLDAE
jgi:tetratricopeptide (TPR) repeat protein